MLLSECFSCLLTTIKHLLLCLVKHRVENKNNSIDAYKKYSLKNLTRMDKIKLVISLNKATHLASLANRECSCESRGQNVRLICNSENTSSKLVS